MGVTIHEKPNGSGIYWLFINHQGKRKAKRVGDKKAAQALARQVEQRLAAKDLGILKEEKTVPLFKEYAAEWLKGYAKVSCKYSTWKNYEGHLNGHLLAAFGNTPITSITRRDIKAFVLSKLTSHLKGASVKRIMSTMSGILGCAYDDELIVANPVARLGRLFKKTGTGDKINPLTQKEVLIFLEAAQKHYAEYYSVFLLAASTGMRMGEVIGLRPSDIDFNSRFIEVQHAIVRGRAETPKNGKKRRVDMSKLLVEVLKKHIAFTKETTLRKGWKSLPQTLFYNQDGKPLDQNNLVKRIFHKCLEKAGLRRVRFHDLRHSFASIHIQNGESLTWIKEQLGHHSIQITVDIYGHLVPGANRDAADRMFMVQLSPQQSATQAQPEACQA